MRNIIGARTLPFFASLFSSKGDDKAP